MSAMEILYRSCASCMRRWSYRCIFTLNKGVSLPAIKGSTLRHYTSFPVESKLLKEWLDCGVPKRPTPHIVTVSRPRQRKKKKRKIANRMNLCRFAQVEKQKQFFEHERRNSTLSDREWAI